MLMCRQACLFPSHEVAICLQARFFPSHQGSMCRQACLFPSHEVPMCWQARLFPSHEVPMCRQTLLLAITVTIIHLFIPFSRNSAKPGEIMQIKNLPAYSASR